MSKKSAVDTLIKLNPKNVSAVIPQATALIKNLKQIQGNPKMFDAVGPKQLLGMLKHIMDTFKIDPKKILSDAEKELLKQQNSMLEKLKSL